MGWGSGMGMLHILGVPVQRQHYVPRFYLERFASRRGQVGVLDRLSGRQFETNPANAAAENDFNALSAETGLPRSLAEDLFGYLEDQAAPTIARVADDGIVLDEDRGILGRYLAQQIVRTKHQRDQHLAMMKWSGTIHAGITLRQRLEANPDDPDRERIEDALDALESGRVTVSGTPDHSIGLAMQAIQGLLPHLLDPAWNWIIVQLPEPRLVTSDDPVTMLGEPIDGYPLLGVGAATALEIWLPLDPRRALVLARDPQVRTPIRTLSGAHIRKINERIVAESYRWVFFRPGTAVPPGARLEAPREIWREDTIAGHEMGEGIYGELVRTGAERINILGERLLSGRRLKPMPTLEELQRRMAGWRPSLAALD